MNSVDRSNADAFESARVLTFCWGAVALALIAGSALGVF
jgi:hypothetical protein